MFVDALDSHYQSVKARLIAANSPYQTKGLMAAMDWPPKDITPNMFYLMNLQDKAAGKTMYSAQTPVKFHFVQWGWMVIGTDLKQGERKDNRGDRFRTQEAMKGALTKALYPQFTEKKTYAIDPTTGVWSGTSLDPVEFITWTPVDFHEEMKQDSGVVYGTALVRIWDMLDQILS